MAALHFKDKLSEYKCDANSAVFLKLVRQPNDIIDDDVVFHPEMSHQIFGQNEVIFGYKGLRINLYYSAAHLTTYLGVTYEEKLSPLASNGIKADNVLEAVAAHIPKGYLSKLDDLHHALEKEGDFRPFGEMISSYDTNIGNTKKCFEIYKTAIDAPGFRAYHERLQTFLLWFVDAASFIDVDDEKWWFYLIFEKYFTAEGRTMYAIVGYQTVYRYYAWPDKVRPRISQVLILPPYQRQGHGGRLLSTFYSESILDPSVLDITVEDPSEEYQKLRDFVDCRNCLQLSAFKKELIMKGFSRDMADQANKLSKMNKRQTRRVYEILRLKYSYPDRLKEYAALIKNRLNMPFKKSRTEMVRLQRCLNAEEYAVAGTLDEEQRIKYLDDACKELMAQYQHTVERLAKDED